MGRYRSAARKKNKKGWQNPALPKRLPVQRISRSSDTLEDIRHADEFEDQQYEEHRTDHGQRIAARNLLIHLLLEQQQLGIAKRLDTLRHQRLVHAQLLELPRNFC